jgi:undecaprenyl-diphosphatase
MATLNAAFHRLTGVHMTLYTVTDWLGLVPVALCVGFGALGLVQWIRRRRLGRVDRSLLALGCFYVAVLGVYLLFEKLEVNYRPVLIDGCLEASYPSSTTLLMLCVMPTAATQLWGRIKRKPLRCCVVCAILGFTLFMVVARLVSGVHWLTDILGGVLLSGGLVAGYEALR